MSKYILIIDDKEGVRDSFLLALEDSPYTIDTASTGEDGIEKAKKRRPDLVFLDLTMPGMGGVNTLRQLIIVCPGVKVYIVTAFFLEYMQELEKLRIDGIDFEICKKPIDISQIQRIVDGVLDESA